MSQENVENVRRGIDAFNRGDLDEWLSGFAPEAELHTTGRFPDEGVYRGRAGLERYWAEIHDDVEEMSLSISDLRASGDRYQTQPLCERVACERVGTGPIKNCTPPSSAFRMSFEEATVQDIAIKGGQAGAKLSNGEAVELFDRSGDLKAGVVEEAGGWLIHKLGGNAGREFFEAAGRSE